MPLYSRPTITNKVLKLITQLGRDLRLPVSDISARPFTSTKR